MFRNERHISLVAVENNVQAVKAALPDGMKLLAVVKADGYGHGGVEAAEAAIKGGASFLAVATVDEGIELRKGGICAPVLVLGIASLDESREAAANYITLTICSPDHVKQLERLCASGGMCVDVHLKIDTGMNRIGARTPEEISEIMQALADCPHVHLTGAFTHFAASDSNDLSFAREQLAKFRKLSGLLPQDIVMHCANSAGIHNHLFCGSEHEMARVGISMYGYPPVKSSLPLKKCMTWKCQVEFVKEISPGDTVGYGCTFTAKQPMKIATITCGYGDGYFRSASSKAKVIIRGRLCPVVGRICMDQMMVDVTGVDDATAGDAAVLMGRDGECEITADDIAEWAGTISYEVLLAAPPRVKRIYD